ncbi:family 1 polysaccharide lyase [Melampsora larici-populina 98AG31]|uniref:pectin lyase n=1 Tax=Melampsora larici-populina (strain 98AG31 / pathotype 3-4-7) TaxID=747676 RepID=F4RS03_MELLP|nr:family 1 polysaccharide lyase [Melampsora larici-populina 98AG31]EGG04771.1 family 1 polysaccharide lyase [Melampsora larici-populina 98AG31]
MLNTSIWNFFFSLFLHIFLITHSLSPVSAGGKPVGFGAAVTGGGNARPVAPANIGELKAWLADHVPRVILIDRVFDFADSEGNVTGPGCSIWPQCSNGALTQVAIDFRGWCGQQKNARHLTVNYRKAAMTPLVIGSNKSLLGVGAKGVIRGKGVVINKPDRNVIIRNIHFTDMNPFAVWGGDSITLNGATDVWIDHCTFSLIGRQMISTGGSFPNSGITISNNHFVGKTPWSTDCLGQHYWTVILGGIGDQITLAENCYVSTSGRSPKLGAVANTRVFSHSFNNYHDATLGQAVEVTRGGTLIVEGDVFDRTAPADPHQAFTETGGALFAPFTPQEAQACQGALGRVCVPNLISRPPPGKAPFKFDVNPAALNAARVLPAVKTAHVQPASAIASRKMSQCGIGKIS